MLVSLFIVVAVASGYPSDARAHTLSLDNSIHSNGQYNFGYKTSNGIDFAENGIGGSHASGSYSYTSPEGQLIQVNYVADENGYRPQGAHLPTPPPIPDYILKSLAYIEAHPFPRIMRKSRMIHRSK